MVQKGFKLYPQDKGNELALRNKSRATERFTFIAGDYSQLELGILARSSRDKKLVNAFNSTDVHIF